MDIEQIYPKQGVYPDFLRNRIERFYDHRVRKEWGDRLLSRGRRPDHQAILVNHNDYLLLAGHAQVREAQRRVLDEEGNGPMMSAVFLNEPNATWDVEQAFAAFVGARDAILTQSGFAANLGLLQVLTGPDTPVYIDHMAHMSLWVGARLGGAKIVPCRHNDVNAFEHKIRRYGSGVVVVDSVYSTDGSVAPLQEICALAKTHGCLMLVDESHSLGTHGPEGRGLVHELGLGDTVDFITASLAKAFAGRAGLIACGSRFKNYFLSQSLPTIFSSATAPHDAAGLLAGLEVIRSADWRRIRLFRAADALRKALRTTGHTISDSRSQIISLNFTSEWAMLDARDVMESMGVFGAPFAPPATPKRRPCLRISVHSGLGKRHIERIVAAARSALPVDETVNAVRAIAC